jgi:hypothetical protein
MNWSDSQAFLCFISSTVLAEMQFRKDVWWKNKGEFALLFRANLDIYL